MAAVVRHAVVVIDAVVGVEGGQPGPAAHRLTATHQRPLEARLGPAH